MRAFSKNLVSGGSIYIFGVLFADALNFFFNLFLGRVLTFEQFGIVTLVSTLWGLMGIVMTAVATTVTQRIAFLTARNGYQDGIRFYKRTFQKALVISILLGIVWFLLVPFTSAFFEISHWVPLFLFTPILVISILTAINRGLLQGELSYAPLGFFQVLEAGSKLLIAIFLVQIHVDPLVYLSIIIAELVDFSVTMLYVYQRIHNIPQVSKETFPFRFFNAAFIAELSVSSFLILDVILAKHFFSPQVAGEYAFLSLFGKIIFYVGSLLTVYIVPLTSRAEGLKKDTKKTFYPLLSGSFVLSATAYVVFCLFGSVTLPVLFGPKAYTILPYLPAYGFAILLFTLSNQVVTYRLSRKFYIFPITALFFAGIDIAGILLFHQTIFDIVTVVLVVSILNALGVSILSIFGVKGEFIRRNILDLLEVVSFRNTIYEKSGGNRTRILIFNWRDTKHLFAGGAEVYIHELAKRWVKEGNSVTLFCGNDGKSLRYEVIDGVHVIRRGGFYFVYIWAFLYYLLKFRGRYDVIIDSENGIPFFTPLYAKEPVYCLMHHVHQDVFRRSLVLPLALFAQFLEKDVTPLVYRKSKFVTVSESTKRDMEKIGLGKAGIDIVHPGVDLSTLSKGEKSKHPTVLYLGRLKFYKSVHVLIKAASEIVKRVPDVEIIIAGDGEESNELKKLAASLGIQKHITFSGKVTEEKKCELYQKAWVFVNPSMMEGWGITTIEANACGTPIVASDVPGLRDAVSNRYSGFLVGYGKTELFAERIIALLIDNDLREKMSGQAIRWAQQFDWDNSAKRYLEIITSDNQKSLPLKNSSFHITTRPG